MSVFGCMVLIILASHAGCADADNSQPAESPNEPAEAPQEHAAAPTEQADAAKEQPETANEQTVVDYDSQTHGAVQVKSASQDPGDSFNVLPEGQNEFLGQPEVLDGTRELVPGAYVIDVNRTRRKVQVEAGKKIVLLTGDLLVESTREGTIWAPRQENEFKYASNPPVVNTRIALFAGTYEVCINVGDTINLQESGTAEVKAGEKTVFKE